MKEKIIIGLLSIATVGSTSYAVIEQQQYNKKIDNTSDSISQYSKRIEDNSDNYNELLNKISVLEEQLSIITSSVDEKANDTQNKINEINSSISNVKQKISTENNMNIAGKWKQTTAIIDENGNQKEINYIYEFKNDGTFFINNEEAGIFGKRILKFNDYRIGIYDIINDKIYISITWLYYKSPTHLYILERV